MGLFVRMGFNSAGIGQTPVSAQEFLGSSRLIASYLPSGCRRETPITARISSKRSDLLRCVVLPKEMDRRGAVRLDAATVAAFIRVAVVVSCLKRLPKPSRCS